MYTHTSRQELRTKIRNKLAIGSENFWPDSEINSAIDEALLTFGAISNFWQEEIFINTQLKKRIYDLFTDNTNANTIAPSITVQKIIDWLNTDLIETLSTLNPINNLYSIDDWKLKLKAAYDQFQRETNLILTKTDSNIGAGSSLIPLADEILDIIRVSFIYKNDNNDEVEIFLNRADEKELAYFDSDSLSEQDLPIYYTSTFGLHNSINIYPIPTINGVLRLITVNGLEAELALQSDTIIPLPNNLVPYLKYGIERELFNEDGLLKDSGRYAYCNKRWQEGIMIGNNYNSVLIPKVNGVIVNIESMHQMDLYFDDSVTPSSVTSSLGLAGFNIFETDNTPDNNVNSIALLCTQNAKLPVVDVDKIQLDKTYLNSLAEYCVHILQLKTGVYDLAATNDAYEQFIKTALNHNQRLQLRGITFENLVESSKQEEKAEPKLVTTNA